MTYEKTVHLLPGVSVTGKEIVVKLSSIINLETGSSHCALIHPQTTCFIEKHEKGYRLINFQDQRLITVIEDFNGNSKIECLLIDSDCIDQVSFFANQFIPHLTPEIKFSSFLEYLVRNEKQQGFLSDTIFPLTENSKKQKLNFNQSSFCKYLGKNSPSQSTINRSINETESKIEQELKKELSSKKEENIRKHYKKWEMYTNTNLKLENIHRTLFSKDKLKELALFWKKIEELKPDTDDWKIFARKLEKYIYTLQE